MVFAGPNWPHADHFNAAEPFVTTSRPGPRCCDSRSALPD